MRSQLQFFMTSEDEAEFVSLAGGLVDSIDHSSDVQWFLRIGDCCIQLLRCRADKRQLIAGRLALATSGFGGESESAARAENAYKKMRNWLKRSYMNRMACRNVQIEGSRMTLSTFWASPRVVDKVRSIPEFTLRQTLGGPVVFELQE